MLRILGIIDSIRFHGEKQHYCKTIEAKNPAKVNRHLHQGRSSEDFPENLFLHLPEQNGRRTMHRNTEHHEIIWQGVYVTCTE